MAEVVVAVVPDEMRANVVCGMLASEGIDCFYRVSREHNTGVVAGLGGGETWVPQEILVGEADVERAQQLLDEHGDV